MPVQSKTSIDSSSGYQPHSKKAKLLHSEADRGEQYLLPNQPGRVPLDSIGWHPQNRGGQGIMPLHVHDIAKEICDTGTSKRRYNQVRLVKVPDEAKAPWLEAVSYTPLTQPTNREV